MFREVYQSKSIKKDKGYASSNLFKKKNNCFRRVVRIWKGNQTANCIQFEADHLAGKKWGRLIINKNRFKNSSLPSSIRRSEQKRHLVADVALNVLIIIIH